MLRSVLLSLLISVFILGAFTLISQEYRSTMQQTLAQPVTAASTDTATGVSLHKSTVQEIWHVR